MIQTSCGGKNGKLNDTIEVSALWTNIQDFLLFQYIYLHYTGPSQYNLKSNQ